MTATTPLPPATQLHRLFEAIGNVAAEMQTTGSIVDRPSPLQAQGATNTRGFLIRSTQKVIDHYRHILTHRRMSEPAWKKIQARLAEQERLLCGLLVAQGPRPAGRSFLEAA